MGFLSKKNEFVLLEGKQRISGTSSLLMSTNGHLPTQYHQEGTSDPTRMNFNETLRSMQQSIEGLARQFQSVARDVEDLKKGKSSAHNGAKRRPKVRGGRRGSLGGRGYHRPQEEFPTHEAWHEYNFYEDYGDNPNVSQAYHGGYYGNQQGDKALDKIKWKVPSFKNESNPNVFLDWERQVENLFMYVPKPQASTYKIWSKKEDTPKVAFKDHSKPKVEEKGRLITNPTRSFKCNGVGHIAINYPTKRTLVFSGDLNSWIEKSDDDFQEGIVDKDESREDQEIVSFEADEEAKTNQGNKLEEKMTKYLVETTLPSKVAPGLTVASRLLPAPSLEDMVGSTLPSPLLIKGLVDIFNGMFIQITEC
ncbi:hypothetical protein M9H77_23776 [Catharanthus roseus]|uniref:Uncharacterized protein n=1 Tax=Catharanthus roseus TaxID=4058 RepID=A0ACC0ATZ6_CATRO|nr:hypothetical protein M9H77_23776 [Catharanthus roseus]